jgi:hypothetical protein
MLRHIIGARMAVQVHLMFLSSQTLLRETKPQHLAQARAVARRFLNTMHGCPTPGRLVAGIDQPLVSAEFVLYQVLYGLFPPTCSCSTTSYGLSYGTFLRTVRAYEQGHTRGGVLCCPSCTLLQSKFASKITCTQQ